MRDRFMSFCCEIYLYVCAYAFVPANFHFRDKAREVAQSERSNSVSVDITWCPWAKAPIGPYWWKEIYLHD